MKKILKRLEKYGLGQLMNETRQNLALSDKAFLRDKEDEADLEKRYEELDLPRKDRILINDYIACMKTAEHRYATLSYLAGIQDAYKIFKQLGLMKKIKVSVK